MMSLKDYIFENEKLQTLRTFINGKIENDKVDKLYDTYIKITGDIEGESTMDILKRWIDTKMSNDRNKIHIDHFEKNLYSACEKNSCYEAVMKLAYDQMNNQANSFYNIVLSNKVVNINDIKSYYEKPYKIPVKFWDSMFNAESPGKPAIGKGEFLLRLISQNPTDAGGDVVINNKKIEVKNLTSNEAKIGNEKLGSTKPIFDFFNDVRNHYAQDIDEIQHFSISKKPSGKQRYNVENIIKVIKAIQQEKDKNKNELLIQYLKNSINKFFYENNTVNIGEKYEIIFQKTIESLLTLDSITSYNLIKIFTLLYIRLYCGEEGADYLCIVDTNHNFIFIKNDDNIYDNMNDDNFPYCMIRCDNSVKKVLIKF